MMLGTVLTAIATWFLFLLGQALYIAKRATLTAASPKNATIHTVGDYLRVHATELTFQISLGAALLLFWSESPDRLRALLAWAHPRLAGIPVLPVTPGTAWLFGLLWQFATDWLAEKYPRFRNGAAPPAGGTNGKP